MGFSSVQSPASGPGPALPSAAQPASAASSAAAANPPAKSFKQVLDDSAKTDKKPGADQSASTATAAKKQTDDTDGGADPTANEEGGGAAVAGESQAAVAHGAGKAAPIKSNAVEVQKAAADAGDDASQQMVNVDAGQIEAVNEEKDSDPGEKKEAPADKSKEKPTTSSSDVSAAVAGTLVTEVNPVQTTALKSEVAEAPVATSIERSSGSKAAVKGSKGPQLKAEEATGPSKAKGSDSAKQPVSGSANDDLASADDAAAISVTAAAPAVAAPKTANQTSSSDSFAAAVQQASDAAQNAAAGEKPVAAQPAAPTLPNEAQFAATNNPQIVSAVHTHLRPNHSLGDLKSQLEAQGVSIEKLHVTQSARAASGGKSDSGDSSRRDGSPTEQQRRDQQRREMLRRMWSKVAGEQFPLDMVA